ncbi:hypothetical protein [Oryza sativa Japonica Group]|uniref:Uncharacterized protein B1129G05.14 n=1 Tax=Oryza sativa subsp. japonica TaxID=39947 RepID=Q657B6_ORYSJ|nr:hypothetical protein [Oryza sativa Japonica Group]
MSECRIAIAVINLLTVGHAQHAAEFSLQRVLACVVDSLRADEPCLEAHPHLFRRLLLCHPHEEILWKRMEQVRPHLLVKCPNLPSSPAALHPDHLAGIGGCSDQ